MANLHAGCELGSVLGTSFWLWAPRPYDVLSLIKIEFTFALRCQPSYDENLHVHRLIPFGFDSCRLFFVTSLRLSTMSTSADDDDWQDFPTSSSTFGVFPTSPSTESPPAPSTTTDKEAFKSFLDQSRSTLVLSITNGYSDQAGHTSTTTSDSKLSLASVTSSTTSTSFQSSTSPPNPSTNKFQNLAPGAKAGVALCIALVSIGIIASVIYLSVRYKKRRLRIHEEGQAPLYGWKPELDGKEVGKPATGPSELEDSTRAVHELPVPWTASELDKPEIDASKREKL